MLTRLSSLLALVALAQLVACGDPFRLGSDGRGNVGTDGTSGVSTLIVKSTGDLIADGTHVATVVATVRDANGTLAPRLPITVTVANTDTNMQQYVGTTDGSGVYSVTVTSHVAGPKVVNAYVTTQHLQTTITFTAPTAKRCSTGPIYGTPPLVTGVGNAADVANIDVNGDGKTDLIFADSSHGGAAVAAATTGGHFSSIAAYAGRNLFHVTT